MQKTQTHDSVSTVLLNNEIVGYLTLEMEDMGKDLELDLLGYVIESLGQVEQPEQPKEKFNTRITDFDYDYFADSYNYIIKDIYDVEVTDTYGTYWDTDFREVANITMSGQELKDKYGDTRDRSPHTAMLRHLGNTYNIEEWANA